MSSFRNWWQLTSITHEAVASLTFSLHWPLLQNCSITCKCSGHTYEPPSVSRKLMVSIYFLKAPIHKYKFGQSQWCQRDQLSYLCGSVPTLPRQMMLGEGRIGHVEFQCPILLFSREISSRQSCVAVTYSLLPQWEHMHARRNGGWAGGEE